ncbi:hypothetical protein PIIN_06167 [Serendipita indica DSM 11827]|uniref:CMP/dCMP-type deaminase domain-containing protein n=1 Tax=Serendipita indica (strain DSM 11827) TaxID=1109443 RepID=G4TLP0_SERID|nr:hypothetical protein PIIN_06167 [Serendipita indica DSM 11827]
MCFTLGAVLVKGGKIISSGYNHYRTHYDGDDSKARGGKPLSMHAEMHAIYNAVGAAPSFKTQFVKAGNAALVSGAGGASATLFEKDEEEEYERGPISTSTPTVLSKQSKGSQPKQGTPAQPSKPMPVSQPASSTSHSRSTSGACATASSSLGNAPPASCFSTGKHKRKPRSPSSSPPRAEPSCYGSVPDNSRDLEQQWRAARAASTSSKLSWWDRAAKVANHGDGKQKLVSHQRTGSTSEEESKHAQKPSLTPPGISPGVTGSKCGGKLTKASSAPPMVVGTSCAKRHGARTRVTGADLYVVRLTRTGALGNAMPCWRCLEWCKWAGVKRIFHYAVDSAVDDVSGSDKRTSGRWICIKVNETRHEDCYWTQGDGRILGGGL